jgi:hypothetical protein
MRTVSKSIKGQPPDGEGVLARAPGIGALNLAISETGEIDSQGAYQVATSSSPTSDHIFFEK